MIEGQKTSDFKMDGLILLLSENNEIKTVIT
jgi:hypothetical protein